MNKLLFVFFVGVSLIISTSFVSAFAVIASHDFNDNDWNGGQGMWNGGWYHEGGNNAKIVNSGYPYEGGYHLRLRSGNGYVERSVNLNGLEDAKLVFYAKVNNFEGSDFADLLITPDGINWNVLKSFSDVEDDNQYHYYEFDLASFGLASNFYLAIDTEMSGTGDYLYIDDLKIVSENAEPPQLPGIKTWHIQFNPTPTNPASDVEYWTLDLFDVSQEEMQNLNADGVFVMCYFSAGSWEDWRPDAGDFPSACLGNSNGWPGEKWLDTNCAEVREIMKNRINLGIAKGCDGFDPDNMDAYGNNPGFPLTEEDAINYYNYLADYVHSQGKQIGLKNALTIIDDVLPNMDWAMNEQCFQYSECGYLQQVLIGNKTVFHLEYGGQNKADDICPQANALGFSTLIKNVQLDEFEIPCWTYLDSVCGNKVVEGTEQCDDGNMDNGDNCTNQCLNNICGDGFVHFGVEECDDSNTNEFDACTNYCLLTMCGDGIIQSPNGNGVNEVCDGSDSSCVTLNGYAGLASCGLDCLSIGECVTNEYCGDWIINGLEVCDGNVISCVTTEGYGGTESCLVDCSSYDICISEEFCGDLIVNGNEECDSGASCNADCTLAVSLIAEDDFENGWNSGVGWKWGWYHQGDSSIVNTGTPYTGNYHLRLRRANGYVDRAVDLSNIENAKLSFWAKVNSFEGNDFADVLVLGGNGWYILKQFTPADSDGVYKYYEFDLTQYGLTDTLYIAVDAQMSSIDDMVYFDGLKIESY